MFTTENALIKYNILMEHCLDGNDLSSYEFPKLKVYLHPWLRDKTISIIASEKGVGKSWVSLFIMRQLIYGAPFCRWELENFADVVLLDVEMAQSDIRKRWELMTTGLDEPITNFTLISADVLGMAGQDTPNLTIPDWREAIFHMLRMTLLDGGLFVIDNISAATPGRIENEKSGWDDINSWLLRIKRELGITIILCCHLPKKGKTPRGTSGIEDSNDTTIILTPVKSPDHAHFKVEFGKHRLFHGDADVKPFELELRPDANGRLEFFAGEVCKPDRRVEIIRLLVGGSKQIEIAGTLDIDTGYISRVVTNAKKAGFLTARGKYTSAGEKVYES